MAPHSITTAVGAVCRCTTKAGLRHSTGSSHTNTIVITAEVEFGIVAKDDLVPSAAVQFPRVRHHSKRRCRWVEVMGSIGMNAVILNVLQPGAFVWFEKTRGPY
ncbi:hypothetical protein TNCV_3436401 [Trichonephila clavipes]|nr:hypothetical protein TNCV_3436401 [Trichonephila clavipes]